ncbi:PREDICTED: putative neutral sphingomyelinase isoform X2 [Priapulus caudatus]|uniref:sphingomyelin phosphodiesterase n=1 Tax=Priapulus caudatus TaxID=37621 RepID=A0ABM1DPF8_PRICU|nr:PREDICTED: putative neutral sphingomyelinase isoform X2 [Priapulus caudatus]
MASHLKFTQDVRVFTLNCWGIPIVYASLHRKERFQAIGEHLTKGNYDIVVLEEVWSHGDFKRLVEQTKDALPYSYYFHSGFLGAGLCIFTRGEIIDTVIHRYSLNGYAHKVQHGDWFGGKCIGLCVIKLGKLRFNVYATHLHAQYSVENDEYKSHRVTQAFETAQFIRATRQNADVTILAGDLNLEPTQVGYKVIRSHAQLQDAWLASENKMNNHDESGQTCDTVHNTYSAGGTNPVRIDHIMYSCNPNIGIRCMDVQLPLGIVPGHQISYSDHEALLAVLRISNDKTDNVGLQPEEGDAEERMSVLTEASRIIGEGIDNVQRSRYVFGAICVVSVCLLALTVNIEFPWGTQSVAVALRICISAAVAYSFWMAVVESRKEIVSMLAATAGLRVCVNTLQRGSTAGREERDARETTSG